MLGTSGSGVLELPGRSDAQRQAMDACFDPSLDKSSQTVFERADERMYQRKKRMKGKGNGWPPPTAGDGGTA